MITVKAETFLLRTWRRVLESQNRSPKTIRTYFEAVDQLTAFLTRVGMPLDPTLLTREHIETFIVELLHAKSPMTALNRYRSLYTYFKWLQEEGEIRESPMARMQPPKVVEQPPDVLSEEIIRKLFKVCEGKSFEQRRDTAILSVLFDTGMRRRELAGLTTEDVMLDERGLRITGKGGRIRFVPIGRRTTLDLDRYERLRRLHKDARLLAYWLSVRRGALTGEGVYKMLVRRSKEAGVSAYVHQFRHTFAHEFLNNGGQETDLMVIAGWRSRSMLNRYGASAAAERAKKAHEKLSPRDRL